MIDTTNDASRIERDLNQTRERLSADLEALQQRLSPGQMVDEALSYVRTGPGREFAGNFAQTVQANPIPVTLVGLGLAWLMLSGRNGGARPSYTTSTYGDEYGYHGHEGDDVASRARSAAERLSRGSEETAEAFRLRVLEAKASVLGVKRQASDTIDAFASSVEKAMAAASERVARFRASIASGARGALESARSGGNYAASTARTGGSYAAGAAQAGGSYALDAARAGGEQAWGAARATGDYAAGAVRSGVSAGSYAASYAGETLYATFQRNPLLMGALGITLGGLVGMLLPGTRREDEAFGEMRDRYRDELYDRASDLADRAGHVAGEVVESGRQALDEVASTARRAASDLAETGRRAAHDVADAGRRAASEQGLTGTEGSSGAERSSGDPLGETARERHPSPGTGTSTPGGTSSTPGSPGTTSNIGTPPGGSTYGGSAVEGAARGAANVGSTPGSPSSIDPSRRAETRTS